MVTITPNWRQPVQVTVAFRTDIVTSRSGREQRRALRSTPRRTVAYTTTVGGDDRRRLVNLLAAQQPDLLTLADPTRPGVLLTGRLTASVTASHPVSRAAEADISFAVEPGSEQSNAGEAQLYVHAGREVFARRPNWANAVDAAFEWPVDQVDFAQGRIATFRPITQGWVTQQATFLGMTPETVAEIEQFFQRMKGRRGEFYMPTWTDDITLAAVAPVDSRALLAAGGTAIESREQAIAVRMHDGRWLFRSVTAKTHSGADTLISISQPWLFDLRPEDVAMICWMPLFRFASDEVTFEWPVDRAAQMQLSMRSLPVTPPERPTTVYDEAARWLLEWWGEDGISAVDRLDYAVNTAYPAVFFWPEAWVQVSAPALDRLNYAINVRYPEIY